MVIGFVNVGIMSLTQAATVIYGANNGTFVETYNYFHSEDINRYLTEFGFTWLVSRRV